MPAVSEFTKAKIVTLHQRGIKFIIIILSSRFWKKAGVFHGTERGTPELSPKSVPVHEE
jgi:hypothetical protein